MNKKTENLTRLDFEEPLRNSPGKKAHFPRVAVGAILLCILAGPVSADLYTVDSTHDPESGNPAACTGGSGNCSLRDALSAADAHPGMDTVVFDVDGTIHLLKQLTVEYPVEIDGGKGTVLRVDQGYEVAILPDRFDEDDNGIYEDIEVLQPSYFSLNGTPRAMLELHGPGSSVRNMIIDGSITPRPGDADVSRIDWNSDDKTDFWLFGHVDKDGDDRLLVAGGIFVAFENYGPVEISDNELRYFSGVALEVNVSAYASLTNNVLSVGFYEGIQVSDGALATIANNTVTGFRNGIAVKYMHTITIRGNESLENRGAGIAVERVGGDFGENLFADNHVAGNENSGMTIAATGYATIINNTVNSNSSHGIDVKSLGLDDENPMPSGYINLIDNVVTENGTDPFIHGGIRIAEGSGYNSLHGNKVHSNSGFGIGFDYAFFNTVQDNNIRDSAFAGIVLLNGSEGNTITANHVEKIGYLVEQNGFGILSFTLNGIFPSDNSIEGNSFRNNSEADIADSSEVCLNSWQNNKFRTEFGPDDCMN